MSSVLIVYASTDGHTALVANFIADVLRAHGHTTEPVDVRHLSQQGAASHDATLVGSPVHVGKHDKRIVEYVKAQRGALDRLPSGLFSVSLAAYGDDGEARAQLTRFEAQTGWHPRSVALVAGALPYTKYGPFKRLLMKSIAKRKPGHLDTDTSRDHVYTDWDAVRRFADGFAEQLSEA